MGGRGGAASSEHPVAVAARQKDWRGLSRLVSARTTAADANAPDDSGRTALHYAAGYGNAAAVRALLACGADANARDRAGMTPLHWSCLKGHAQAVDALCLGGADALISASAGIFRGRTALDLVGKQHDGEGGRSDPEVSRVLLRRLGTTLFDMRKLVGRGAYASVIKARRRDTGMTVALKAVRKHAGEGAGGSDGGGGGGGGAGSARGSPGTSASTAGALMEKAPRTPLVK